jgi:hypothetical protein
MKQICLSSFTGIDTKSGLLQIIQVISSKKIQRFNGWKRIKESSVSYGTKNKKRYTAIFYHIPIMTEKRTWIQNIVYKIKVYLFGNDMTIFRKSPIQSIPEINLQEKI